MGIHITNDIASKRPGYRYTRHDLSDGTGYYVGMPMNPRPHWSLNWHPIAVLLVVAGLVIIIVLLLRGVIG